MVCKMVIFSVSLAPELHKGIVFVVVTPFFEEVMVGFSFVSSASNTFLYHFPSFKMLLSPLSPLPWTPYCLIFDSVYSHAASTKFLCLSQLCCSLYSTGLSVLMHLSSPFKATTLVLLIRLLGDSSGLPNVKIVRKLQGSATGIAERLTANVAVYTFRFFFSFSTFMGHSLRSCGISLTLHSPLPIADGKLVDLQI